MPSRVEEPLEANLDNMESVNGNSTTIGVEKKENETKEEVIGQKYFDKNDTGFEKVFFKAPSSGEKQSGKIVWMDIFLGVCMVGLIGISVCLKD